MKEAPETAFQVIQPFTSSDEAACILPEREKETNVHEGEATLSPLRGGRRRIKNCHGTVCPEASVAAVTPGPGR